MDTTAAVGSQGVTPRRLFIGICLALIPTGASFALVSNILIPLKEEFILTNYQVGLNSRLPGEPLVWEAAAVLYPAEAHGGQVSFRWVAPAALLLILAFGLMYVRDRAQGSAVPVADQAIEDLPTQTSASARSSRRCRAGFGSRLRSNSNG
jgi:hypothetical protein